MDRKKIKSKSRKIKSRKLAAKIWYEKYFILKVLFYIPLVYFSVAFLLFNIAKNFVISTYKRVQSYSSRVGDFLVNQKNRAVIRASKLTGSIAKFKPSKSIVLAQKPAFKNLLINLRSRLVYELQGLKQEIIDLRNLFVIAAKYLAKPFMRKKIRVVKIKKIKVKRADVPIEGIEIQEVPILPAKEPVVKVSLLSRILRAVITAIIKVILWPFVLILKILKAIFSFEIRFKLFSFRTLLLVTFLTGIYLGSAFYFIIWEDLPKIETLSVSEPRQTTTIYDRKGNVLYRLYNDEDRTLVPLNEVPQDLLNATIAIEDAAFFEHRGLSIRGIVRAAKKTFFEDDLEGGSTITQQLVKNTLLTPERTYERKAKEAVMAVEVERRYSKEQILEMYLNRISYGGTSYGVKSAAKRYFGKELNDLTLAESAFLAGLPVAPSKYSPFAGNLEAGKERQKLVLDRMVLAGYIGQEEADKALEEKLEFKGPSERIIAPHFVNYVIAELEDKYGQLMVMQGGLDVFTSIDLELQTKLEEIVVTEVTKMRRNNVSNGAALITNPKTGEVLAMVGSANYWDTENDGNVNITTSLRQPGSSIKPVTYSLALENGFTLSTIIEDRPVTYEIPGQEPYKPVNYDGRFHGRLTLKQALANSYNIPAVKVLDKLGVSNLVEHGKNMGITTWDDSSRFGLSLTLGAGEVKMTDMAVVYGVFANQGYRKDLNPILKIYDSYGNPIEENDCVNFMDESPSILTRRALFETNAWASVSSPQITRTRVCDREKVLSETTAYLIGSILTDNRARSAAFGSNSELNVTKKQFAVKTGTTNSVRDNWAVGYNDDFVVVTWIGNNYNEPMKGVASGYGGSSTIWRKAVDHLIENREMAEKISRPSGLVEVSICPITNTLACSGCPNVTQIYERGKEPTEACDPRVIREILNKDREDEDKNEEENSEED